MRTEICESIAAKIGEPSEAAPYGVWSTPPLSSFVVLDKSFLDSVTWPLQYCACADWTFGIAPVLMYEHFRKEDRRRKANLFKLHKIEENLAIVPGIGEMFRQEGETLKPSSTIMRAKRTTIMVEKGPSGEYFE